MLIVFVVSVQPFADIVANYTCYDRNQKGYCNVAHFTPPFRCQIGEDNIYIITYANGIHKDGKYIDYVVI